MKVLVAYKANYDGGYLDGDATITLPNVDKLTSEVVSAIKQWLNKDIARKPEVQHLRNIRMPTILNIIRLEE